jgi:hypothetical protein
MTLNITGNSGEIHSHALGLFIILAAEAEVRGNKKKSE